MKKLGQKLVHRSHLLTNSRFQLGCFFCHQQNFEPGVIEWWISASCFVACSVSNFKVHQVFKQVCRSSVSWLVYKYFAARYFSQKIFQQNISLQSIETTLRVKGLLLISWIIHTCFDCLNQAWIKLMENWIQQLRGVSFHGMTPPLKVKHVFFVFCWLTKLLHAVEVTDIKLWFSIFQRARAVASL